jgi:hypothetical protein
MRNDQQRQKRYDSAVEAGTVEKNIRLLFGKTALKLSANALNEGEGEDEQAAPQNDQAPPGPQRMGDKDQADAALSPSAAFSTDPAVAVLPDDMPNAPPSPDAAATGSLINSAAENQRRWKTAGAMVKTSVRLQNKWVRGGTREKAALLMSQLDGLIEQNIVDESQAMSAIAEEVEVWVEDEVEEGSDKDVEERG